MNHLRRKSLEWTRDRIPILEAELQQCLKDRDRERKLPGGKRRLNWREADDRIKFLRSSLRYMRFQIQPLSALSNPGPGD